MDPYGEDQYYSGDGTETPPEQPSSEGSRAPGDQDRPPTSLAAIAASLMDTTATTTTTATRPSTLPPVTTNPDCPSTSTLTTLAEMRGAVAKVQFVQPDSAPQRGRGHKKGRARVQAPRSYYWQSPPRSPATSTPAKSGQPEDRAPQLAASFDEQAAHYGARQTFAPRDDFVPHRHAPLIETSDFRHARLYRDELDEATNEHHLRVDRGEETRLAAASAGHLIEVSLKNFIALSRRSISVVSLYDQQFFYFWVNRNRYISFSHHIIRHKCFYFL